MRKSVTALAMCSALALSVAPAFAQSAGDWTLGLGVHTVEPKSDNGSLASGTLDLDVGNSVRPTITFEYFIRDNLGIEVLGALPFEHNLNIDGLGKIGSTKHLPPTVSLQYHFNSGQKFSPFVGAGINYTTFFDEDAKGALSGSKLSLSDSWGLALHAGIDYQLNDRGALRTDIRWIDIDSDVRLDGTKIGTAKIDPVVFGVAYVMKF